MINSLSDAFATPPEGLPTLALDPSAAPPELKKAFHLASRAIHPDKVRSMPTPRRAEAEEVFKVLAAAYHSLEAEA